jgi:hypothetical protein
MVLGSTPQPACLLTKRPPMPMDTGFVGFCLNPTEPQKPRRKRILSPMCLPFHHAGEKFIYLMHNAL